jgi:hypothetical protein
MRLGHNDPPSTLDHKLRTIRESGCFVILIWHSRTYLSNCIHSYLCFPADESRSLRLTVNRIDG